MPPQSLTSVTGRGHEPRPAGLSPAIGYIRVSMAREEMISPELQRAAIEPAAARDGYYIAKWIEELDITGRHFGRKGVQAAIGLVEDGTYRRVYVWRFSRFGRNARLVAMNNARIEEAGGELRSATEAFDASTAIGRFSRGMVWQIDELQSDLIGDSWRDAHANRRKNGLPHDGKPRLGYLYHRPSTAERLCPQGCRIGECTLGYVIDPATSAIPEEMYRRYVAGGSYYKIARWLNGKGITTTRGHQWNVRNVRRFLDTGFAAGLLQVHNEVCTCKKPHDCSNKTYVDGAHEAIIPAQVWEEYRRQRKRRRKLAPRVENPVYPLAGLVRCGRCDGPMNAQGMMHRGTYKPGYMYHCSRYSRGLPCDGAWIVRPRLEKRILDWVGKVAAADVEEQAAIVAARLEAKSTLDADRERLKGEAKRCMGELTALTVNLAKGIVPEPAYVAARDEIQARLDAVNEALEELDEAVAGETTEPPVAVAQGLVAEWLTLTPEDRQRMMARLIQHVTVTSHGNSRQTLQVLTTWGESVTV